MTRTSFVALIVLLAVLFSGRSNAQLQDRFGTITLGARGGLSIWNTEFDKKKIGPSGDIMVRWALGRGLSLAALGGIEELKAESDAPVRSVPYGVELVYEKLLAFPFSGVVMYNFTKTKISPYVYAGAGGMAWQRKVNLAQPLPDTKYRVSSIFPVGVGLECAVSTHVALAFDAGVRFHRKDLDLLVGNKLRDFYTAKLGLHFTFGSTDNDDDDHDGLTNAEEKRYGTDPENPDTDGDGLSDGDEVHLYRTNPLKADTDGDGLNDGAEVLNYRTDPTKYDTDGDGLSDGDEVNIYHTDPLKADTDGDGLSDGDEVKVYHTDPLKVDTDGDGLSDWDEVMAYHTDPNNPDTDGDGLTDGEEIHTYKTDPLKADTDGGSVPDGVEVKRGTNPLDPRDDIAVETFKLERGGKVLLQGINFETGSARLTQDSEGTLLKVLRSLMEHPEVSVEIAGYTDNVGSASKNATLSLKRAQAVKTWLVVNGISSSRMTTKGYGPQFPISTNTTAEGRAQNRRIEFHVQ